MENQDPGTSAEGGLNQGDVLMETPSTAAAAAVAEIIPPKIEDLPLDKKLEALKKHNHYENFNEGRFIDAQDTVNTWCLGKIVEVDQRLLRIHYDGWSSKWDIVSLPYVRACQNIIKAFKTNEISPILFAILERKDQQLQTGAIQKVFKRIHWPKQGSP